MARPAKLTPGTAAAIIQATREGLPRRFAAARAGVGLSTLFSWLKTGRKAKCGPYREFLDGIKKAEAEAVAARLATISAAGNAGTWQSAAWWLERRYPEEFGTQRSELRELQAMLREVETLLRERQPTS
jgi:transposase